MDSSILSSLSSDYRIRWIQQRVETVLQDDFSLLRSSPQVISNPDKVPFEMAGQTESFANCLNEKSKTNLQILSDFLNDSFCSMSALVFFVEKSATSIMIRAPYLESSAPVETSLDNNFEMIRVNEPSIITTSSIHEIADSAHSAETNVKVSEVVYQQTELRMAVRMMPDYVVGSNVVYFLRNQAGSIPIPISDSDAGVSMPALLECGYLSSQALTMLDQLLQDIYIPLISSANLNSSFVEMEPGEDLNVGRVNELQSELLQTLHRFQSHVTHTVQQVAGETRLQIPEELSELNTLDPSQVASVGPMITRLETLASEWISTVSGALTKEHLKIPMGNVIDLINERGHWQK